MYEKKHIFHPEQKFQRKLIIFSSYITQQVFKY